MILGLKWVNTPGSVSEYRRHFGFCKIPESFPGGEREGGDFKNFQF